MTYSQQRRNSELEIQRAEFARKAASYDETHTHTDEHGFALAWLCSCCDFFGFQTILEVGAGTGRFVPELAKRCPAVKYLGVEPVEELRRQGCARGLPAGTLVDGSGYDLAFPDGAFDTVFECAMLHHVKRPDLVIAEMLRVARKAIFISDNNCFGHGSLAKRMAKHALRAAGLWQIARYLNTGGRGHLDYGDGVSYSYSVFDNIAQIRRACDRIYILNTEPTANLAPLWGAPHIALLALKRGWEHPTKASGI
jgi:SAM-dependent methyltransferase